MESKEDDFVQHMYVASAHSDILFFTNTGRCFSLKVYRIPEASRYSRGRPVVNLLNLQPHERVAAFVPVRQFDQSHYIIMATEHGVINKQPLSAYANVRRDGVKAIHLDEGDTMIECKLTRGNDDIILGTAFGQAVRFHESASRELGRSTRGMRGITLRGGDRVIGMIVVDDLCEVLTVTQNGYGKRTPVPDYRRTNRGGTGIINIKCSDKVGEAVGIKRVSGSEDVMLITRNGIVIRSDVSAISVIGRNTQGVKLMSLEPGDSVIDCAMCDKTQEIEIDNTGEEK
jgi:DNA gyrase subunit A